MKYIRPNDVLKIFVQCMEQVVDTEENRQLMKRINAMRNVYYTHIFFRTDGIDKYTDCYLNSEQMFCIADNIGNDSFNLMIEKCATDNVFCGLHRQSVLQLEPHQKI